MPYKGKTAAEYKNSYEKEKYDRIVILAPRGEKEMIRVQAESCGESVNAYILRLIRADMETASPTAKASPETETET